MRFTAKSLIVAAVLLVAGGVASAGTLTVFSDVNIFNDDPLLADNDQLALNLLGGNTNVLISTQIAGGVSADGLNTYYSSLGGITTTRTSAPLTGALLVSVDFLVLDIDFQDASPYDAGEVAVLTSFLSGGGDLALIAESTIPGDIASYNDLLTSLGSTISYESTERRALGLQLADTVLPVPLTAGVTDVSIGAINNLLGGTPAVQDEGFTAIAFEPFGTVTAIPEPGSMLLFGLGILGLGAWRRRENRAA